MSITTPSKFQVSLAFLLTGLALGCSKKQGPVEGSAGAGTGSGKGLGGSTSPTGTGTTPSGFGSGINLGNVAGAAGGGGVSGLGACGGVISKARLRAANLLLVLDLSASMKTTFGTTNASRWSAVTTSLGSALTAVQDRAAFGVDLYPVGGEECSLPTSADLTVAVAPGKDSVGPIKAALALAIPAGGTPTAAALTRALQYFTTGAGMGQAGDKFVVLATDGGPNCNVQAAQCQIDQCTSTHDRPEDCANVNCCQGVVQSCLDESGTLAAISALAASNIKTVVVGLPGVAPYAASLNAFAQAGGLPQAGTVKYFAIDEMLGVAGLTDTFQSITTELIKSCRLELEMAPPDPTKVNVIIDGTTLAQSGADGWDFDNNMTPPGIVVKGATCKALEQMGAEKVTVQFGCPTMVVR